MPDFFFFSKTSQVISRQAKSLLFLISWEKEYMEKIPITKKLFEKKKDVFVNKPIFDLQHEI